MAQITPNAPKLYVVGDRGVCVDDNQWIGMLARVASALEGHQSVALQVRHKLRAAPLAYACGAAANDALKPAIDRGLNVLWNTCFDAPGLCLFSGLHLSQAHAATCLAGCLPNLVGASVHDANALDRAVSLGACFVVFGPVFDPGSKPGVKGVGLKALRELTALSPVPVLAIGGVTPERVDACLAAGAWGVACVTPVFTNPNPSVVIERYLDALDQTDHNKGAVR